MPQHNDEGNFGTRRHHIAQDAVVPEGAEELGIMGAGVAAKFLLTRCGFQGIKQRGGVSRGTEQLQLIK